MITTVILHTVNGDVRSTYGREQHAGVMHLIAQYVADGKRFSVVYEG
jgi:hypothetical protein